MAINFDHRLFRSIAAQVEKEYQMGGLSHGLYCDFAHDCAMRYAAARLGEAKAVRADRPTAKIPVQGSPNDLTDGERLALGHLAQAWDAFCSLPAQHEADKDEFMRAIHAAQSIIYTRLALRVLGVRFGEDA